MADERNFRSSYYEKVSNIYYYDIRKRLSNK